MSQELEQAVNELVAEQGLSSDFSSVGMRTVDGALKEIILQAQELLGEIECARGEGNVDLQPSDIKDLPRKVNMLDGMVGRLRQHGASSTRRRQR